MHRRFITCYASAVHNRFASTHTQEFNTVKKIIPLLVAAFVGTPALCGAFVARADSIAYSTPDGGFVSMSGRGVHLGGGSGGPWIENGKIFAIHRVVSPEYPPKPVLAIDKTKCTPAQMEILNPLPGEKRCLGPAERE
jgi:hypothetical protein